MMLNILKSRKRMKCRFSNQDIDEVISFGKMPLGNGFLTKKNLGEKEYFYEMKVAVNTSIGLLQLEEQPLPSKMFHGEYAFFSRTSNFMKNHFKNVASEIIELLSIDFEKDLEQLVIEIGSNDGVMLEHIVKKNINAIGVEPSINVANESHKYGVKTINEFFSEKLANKISSEIGNANIIYAANVFCHIPNINDLAKACSSLLKDGGVLIFEDPYLGDVLEKNSFDQIYDEHVFLFSCHAVQAIFMTYGLTLFDCKKINTHGGSVRYYLSKNSTKKPTLNLRSQLDYEIKIGLLNMNCYSTFSEKCNYVKSEFKKQLLSYKSAGNKILGYGATSKSTTILNYCDIGPEIIDHIVDTTPNKIGKYSPGKHIPILDYSKFFPYPDVSVLFAWNHRKEILEKEKSYGGIWITHLYDELKKII